MIYNINLQNIADTLDFDLEDIEMLMEVFIETTTQELQNIQIACDENNFEVISQIAHSIKGSAANLTLMEISNLAKDIEYSAKEEMDINYQDKINTLKNLVNNI